MPKVEEARPMGKADAIKPVDRLFHPREPLPCSELRRARLFQLLCEEGRRAGSELLEQLLNFRYSFLSDDGHVIIVQVDQSNKAVGGDGIILSPFVTLLHL